MNAVNAAMRAIMGPVMGLFAGAPPWVALMVLSLISGVLAAVIFRFTSNQTALRRVADRTRANLLALRLYKDDTLITFRAIGGLLWASLLRLVHSLTPMVVLLPLFVLILAQMAMYFEFRPLVPGEAVTVEARIAPDAWNRLRNRVPDLPDGVRLEARVRDPADHAIYLRLRAEKPTGPARIVWRLPEGGTVEKQLVVVEPGESDRLWFVSPLRPGTSFLDRLLYPGEPAFDSLAPIQRIEIKYPTRDRSLIGIRESFLARIPGLGWLAGLLALLFDTHWIVTFFVVSIIGALAAKPFIKVQF